MSLCLQSFIAHCIYFHWYSCVCSHTHTHSNISTLKHTACCVVVLADVGGAGQRLEVLHVPPGVLLIVPDVVNDVSCHHGEPAEHGHKHGHVCRLLVKGAKVDPGVQDLDHRLPHVLLLHRRVAAHVVHRLGVEPELPQHLLQGALAVPGVVGQADAGVELGEGVLWEAAEVVVGKIQDLQALGNSLKGADLHALYGVVR